jgi:hypothetical protein
MERPGCREIRKKETGRMSTLNEILKKQGLAERETILKALVDILNELVEQDKPSIAARFPGLEPFEVESWAKVGVIKRLTSNFLGWGSEYVCPLVGDLLEDINFHDEAAQVRAILGTNKLRLQPEECPGCYPEAGTTFDYVHEKGICECGLANLHRHCRFCGKLRK